MIIKWREVFHIDLSNILPLIISAIFITAVIITIFIIMEVNTK